MRPAGVQQDIADEAAIKSWLDTLARGGCDAGAFLQAMQGRFSSQPEKTWEVLSQLDQYFRLGRIETEAFKTIKTALAESVLGRDVPVARDIVIPVRAEHTDAHPRVDESQSPDEVGEPKAGSVLRRRYRIEALVGQSSMGTVFQALDEFRLETPGSQRLAVKVLHAAVTKRAELLAELRREFQSLQLLSHPNIVRVFEFDRDGPLVFFTMELLTGAPLSRVMQVRKLIPLERTQALAVIRDVGVALAYAHSRGVVHGDLNLRNIFVTGAGELRVMGFGGSQKSRQISGASDHETLPFAASAYASCQVLEGEHPDARDDVFALACIAYLLLSGDHPFSMKTAIDARQSGLRLRRPAGLSGRQWQAVRAALQWQREQRPADVQEWLRQMDLRGAARRSAPLTDHLEPPLLKESRSRLATGIAAGVVLLLAGAYWILSHRDTLPRVDSTAQVRVPDSLARPSASPPPARIPVPASQDAPAATPRAPAPAASSATHQPAAAPRVAGRRVAAPPVAAPPVAASPVASPPAAASPVAAPPLAAPPVAAPPVAAPPVAAPPAAAPTAAATQRVTARPVAVPSAASAGASRVELTTDTVEVAASEPSAQVTVHRKGNLRGSTSFTWWTESGTAKPGADFSAAVPQLAYIGDGKSTASLSIPVSNSRHAQSKSFYVVIDQSEGGALLGARTLTMVTLLPRE
jgi:serine/threonine protein kinase